MRRRMGSNRPRGPLRIRFPANRSPAQHAPAPVARSTVKPLTAQAFVVQFTMSQRAHDKLRYLQELLGHQVPSGDIAEVVERALDLAIGPLE